MDSSVDTIGARFSGAILIVRKDAPNVKASASTILTLDRDLTRSGKVWLEVCFNVLGLSGSFHEVQFLLWDGSLMYFFRFEESSATIFE